MLKCERRYWGVPPRGLFIEEFADTATPLWIRLKSAYNFRFAQFFEHFGFSISNSTHNFLYLYWRQWHWSIWISFNFIDSLSKPIWLTNDHRWRRLMMFSSFVKKDMLSWFLNLIMNKMNESTMMIWFKFLIWLTHHQRIISIYFTNRHRISKTLNYASKIIFIVFDCDEFSITASDISNKFDLIECNEEKNENFSFVNELLLDVEGA